MVHQKRLSWICYWKKKKNIKKEVSLFLTYHPVLKKLASMAYKNIYSSLYEPGSENNFYYKASGVN